MLRISGPELIHVSTVNEKTIILFGDEHNSIIGKCKKCIKNNCLLIDEFLNKLEPNSDIFIESPWKLQTYEPKKTADFISKIQKKFNNKLYKHKNINNENRFHYTDIRTEPNISIVYNTLHIYYHQIEEQKYSFLNVIYDFKTINHFVDYLNACIKSRNFIATIQKHFGKEYIDKNSLTSLPLNTKRTIHRIKKQLIKLSKKDKQFLMKFHDDRIKELLKQPFSIEYENNRNIVISKETIKGPYAARVFQVFFHFMAHLMDMYHLSRMLYYIHKTKILVSYTGSDHTHRYIHFFQRFYKSKTLHYNDKSEQTDDLSNKRCIDIPIQIAKTLIQQSP